MSPTSDFDLLRLILNGLSNTGSFIALVTATVVVFVLWRRKEGGAGGAFLLMLARTGVWLVTLGYLVLDLLLTRVDPMISMWGGLGLKVLLLLSTVMTAIALLLIKPKPAQGAGGVR
jgi:hypothetical protein